MPEARRSTKPRARSAAGASAAGAKGRFPAPSPLVALRCTAFCTEVQQEVDQRGRDEAVDSGHKRQAGWASGQTKSVRAAFACAFASALDLRILVPSPLPASVSA
jgi:hypothetical protein